MQYNPERMAGKLGMKKTPFMLKALQLVGKLFDKLTCGGVCRLFFVKCHKSIKKMLLKDYIVQLVQNLFAGNQPFVEGSPEGDALLGILKRLRFILNKISVKDIDGNKVDLFEILKHSAGNYGIDDHNAVLKLK